MNSMCGIVGYVGPRSVQDVVIGGLRKLEYRGYDSAGIASLENGKVTVMKSVGRLANLEDKLATESLQGHLGIGHTRWATHGRPSDENAHPHSDCHQRICVVHNGIVENFATLQAQLLDRGHRFSSQTDTEVLAHLIEDEL